MWGHSACKNLSTHTHTCTPVVSYWIHFFFIFIIGCSKCTLNEVQVRGLLFNTQYPCLMLSIVAQCQCTLASLSSKRKSICPVTPYPMCHRCHGFYGDALLQTKHVKGTPPAEGGGITLWQGYHTQTSFTYPNMNHGLCQTVFVHWRFSG